MNKLLLVGDNTITPGNYLISYDTASNLTINGEVTLNNPNNPNHDLTINLENNAQLNYHAILYLTTNNNLTITTKNNNVLNLNLVIINTNKNKFTITINMLGSTSRAKISIRALNTDSASNLDIICNGNISKNTFDNEILEDLKGLILHNDSLKISPNITVSTNEVMANHLVTIGSFNPEDLFYLATKDLSIKTAKNLLLHSFVTSILPQELHEYLKMEVIKFE